MTHYETLGVSESATPDEIKRAYRKLASQHHPDKGGDTEKFQEIQTAYDTLADGDRRQRYDHERRNPGMGPGGVHFTWHNGNGMPGGMEDIFRQFGFPGGDPFAQFRQQQPRRNKDLRIEIALPLVTTLEEQTKTISVQTTNGTRDTVEVKIPRGVTTGTQIKYSGLGDNLFNTLPRGDLYVLFNVHAAENFNVHGLDLYTKFNVNCLIAIVGGSANITGLDGREFVITIPPGTQPGIKFRIAEQGLYAVNSEQRGNLYAEMNITVPIDLSQDQINTIRYYINPN